VGLNLTGANHVFLTDLWWTKATDDQAIDRLHRLGQKKNVFVKKFLVNDSIDMKILDIQQKKEKIISDSFVHNNDDNNDVSNENRMQILRNLLIS
jgi:DNA repair protein RAD5